MESVLIIDPSTLFDYGENPESPAEFPLIFFEDQTTPFAEFPVVVDEETNIMGITVVTNFNFVVQYSEDGEEFEEIDNVSDLNTLLCG